MKALQFAEKLAFGWRSAFSAAIKLFFSVRALASEGSEPSFSANCLAAKRRKNAAHGASRGFRNGEFNKPQRGERVGLMQSLHPEQRRSSGEARTYPERNRRGSRAHRRRRKPSLCRISSASLERRTSHCGSVSLSR